MGAAAATLAVKGYAGTRLSDVAEIAGIQTPGIYYYFSSREELVEEVLRVGISRIGGFVQEAVAGMSPDASASEKIACAIRAHLTMVLLESDYSKAATRNSGQVPEAMQRFLIDAQQEYLRMWRSLIREAANQLPANSERDVRTMTLLVLGALNWAPEWWSSEKYDLENLIVTTQDFVFGALGLR